MPGQTYTAIGILLGGVLLILFCKPLARTCIEMQNEFWGFHFGERWVKPSMFVIVTVGIGWITLAVLILLGVIHPRGRG
jgi:hypothetical protein